MKRSVVLLIAALCGMCALGPGRALAQADYRARPTLDFFFLHLELRMQVNPEGTVSGEAAYRVEANVDGADSLVLDAAHMEIESVTVDDAETGYRLHNDSLFVFMADSALRGTEYRVGITYRATPRFGLLRNGSGTLWTSRLPLGNRHWAPLPDHPRQSFTTALTFSVPSGYRVMAPGRQVGEEVNTVDRITYRFESVTPLPASALSWAMGRFRVSETGFDAKGVLLYTEEGAASDSLREALLGTAYETVRRLEERAGMEYPWERLHILLLDDHHWETKSWGASTVFLYRNMGPLDAQLRRAVAAQWFGVWQREEQWSDAEAMNLYQTLLAGGEGEEPLLLESAGRPGAERAESLYAVFGPRNWNLWQRGLPGWQGAGFRSVIRGSVAEVLSEGPGVYRWEEYASHWYRESGQPLFSPPRPGMLSSGETGDAAMTGRRTAGGEAGGPAAADSVVYRVDYRLNEADGALRLVFTALRGVTQELTAVRGIAVGSGGSRDTSEVTFTGRRDSVVVSVSPTANTYYLDPSGRPGLYLEQYKPVPYLIYELRNSESLQERVEAARRLGSHTGNPDLQLAIRDVMQGDPEPEVRAALMESLASITGGAAGTEQQFLSALGSEEPAIRRSALSALRNYKGNEQVRSQVESLAMRTGDLELYREAARALSSVGDEEQLITFSQNVIRSDTAGRKAIFAIGLLAEAGATDRVVEYAEHYTVPRFPYEVRTESIRLLSRYDRAVSDWVERAGSLLEDPDPRIRYLAVQALAGFDDPSARELLQNHLAEEYDLRVRPASTSRSP